MARGVRCRSLAITLAFSLSSIAAAGCTLSRGALGSAPGLDAGASRVDGGSLDTGPRNEAGTDGGADDGGADDDGGTTAVDAYVELRDAGECSLATDCPAPTEGAWTDCAFGDTCSPLGSQSRTSTTYSCDLGVCVGRSVNESRECPRTTDGTPCGSGETCTECTGGTACGSEPMGTQSCTTMTCRGGTCGANVESRACSPPGSEYCDSPGAWGPCRRNLSGECTRGRSRTTCAFSFCTVPAWETEPCTGC
jgi:hypothetical protein